LERKDIILEKQALKESTLLIKVSEILTTMRFN